MSNISRKTAKKFPDEAMYKVQYLEKYVPQLNKQEIDVLYYEIANDSNLEFEDVNQIAIESKRFNPPEHKIKELDLWFQSNLKPNK